jgi:hypothetical protein
MCAPCARQRPGANKCVEGAVRRRSPLSGTHGLGPVWNRASGIATSPHCLLLFSILHSSLAPLRILLSHFHVFFPIPHLCNCHIISYLFRPSARRLSPVVLAIAASPSKRTVSILFNRILPNFLSGNYTCSSNSCFSSNDPCCLCLSASKIQSRCSFTPM